jgi:hypothetical protein
MIVVTYLALQVRVLVRYYDSCILFGFKCHVLLFKQESVTNAMFYHLNKELLQQSIHTITVLTFFNIQ